MYPSLTLYDMVDVCGLDLADVVGKTYVGLYNKLFVAMQSEYDIVLYNWYCAKILLPPSDVTLAINSDNFISINGIVFVRPNDTVYIPSMAVIPVIEQLSVIENGTYVTPSGIDGFGPVIVSVPQPQPVLESLSVTANGVFTPSAGVDGFNSVSVQVPLNTFSVNIFEVNRISSNLSIFVNKNGNNSINVSARDSVPTFHVTGTFTNSNNVLIYFNITASEAFSYVGKYLNMAYKASSMPSDAIIRAIVQANLSPWYKQALITQNGGKKQISSMPTESFTSCAVGFMVTSSANKYIDVYLSFSITDN